MALRSIAAGACIALLLAGCWSDEGSVGTGPDSAGTGADVAPAKAEPSVESLGRCPRGKGRGGAQGTYAAETVGSRSPREALVESVSNARRRGVDFPIVPETIPSEYRANGYVDVYGDGRRFSYVENGRPVVIWWMQRLPTNTWVPWAIGSCERKLTRASLRGLAS